MVNRTNFEPINIDDFIHDPINQEKVQSYPPELVGRFNSFIVTAFDDSMTVEMQLRTLIKWIKENIDVTTNALDNMEAFKQDSMAFQNHVKNTLVNLINQFTDKFDDNLKFETMEILKKWLNDGVLAYFIRDIINEEVYHARGSYSSLGDRLSYSDRSIVDTMLKYESLSSQISNILAIAGDGTVPTELVDVRVGIDGTKYDTAGEAVRKQIDLTEKSISNIYDYFTNSIGGNVLNSNTEILKILPSTNVWEEEMTLYAYTTYQLYVQEDCHVWLNELPTYYFSIALHEGKTVVKDKFIARYRTEDNNLPTLDNKLLVKKDTLISITVEKEVEDWELSTDYRLVKSELSKNIKFGAYQINQLKELFPYVNQTFNRNTRLFDVRKFTSVAEEMTTLYSYTSYLLYIEQDCHVWVDTIPDYYFSISLHKGKEVIKDKFIARYRTLDNNLPTYDNKLLIKAGTLMSITVANEATDWTLKTDYELIKPSFTQNVELGKDQINQIKELFPYADKTFNRDTPLFDVRKFTSVWKEMITLYSYTSYLLYIEQDCHVWVDTIPDYYFSISLHEGREVVEDKFIARYRTLDDNLPTEDNQLLIKAGTLMSITVANEATDWILNTDYELVKPSFSQNVELGRSQINQIKSLFPNVANASFCNYVNGEGDQESTERLEIYLPSGIGYIKYQFVHSVSTDINADCWHIYKTDYVDNNLNHVTELTQSGEWETAIRLDMRDDFSGGYLHGDEKTTSINIFVDGKHINNLSVLSKVSFDNLRIVASSELYDPKDHTTLIAENGKEYVFSKESLTINQRLTWKVDETLTTSYLAMFPVNKTVTNKIYTDKDFNVRDITYGEIEGVRSAVTFNDNFVAKFSIPKYSTKLSNPVYLITDNGGRSYNKQYYIASRAGQTVTVGEVWETETVYELQYAEQV